MKKYLLFTKNRLHIKHDGGKGSLAFHLKTNIENNCKVETSLVFRN
jgi:hypothetical protein